MNSFGAYLKGLRTARRWSLREAAERLGISTSRLAELERGKSYHTDHATRPSIEFVERLALTFEVPREIAMAEAGFPSARAPELDPDAARMLALFQSLEAPKRRLALGIVRLLAEDGQ